MKFHQAFLNFAWHDTGRSVGQAVCVTVLNDPERTARDFRTALESEFAASFSDVVFAIADWSPQRKFLGPFRDVFAVNAN